MSDTTAGKLEAPTGRISTDAEYHRALERLRELEAANPDTSEALEQEMLQRAIAEFLNRKEASRSGVT